MNECILVVDDDPEIVGAIAITLEREGYLYTIAGKGAFAARRADVAGERRERLLRQFCCLSARKCIRKEKEMVVDIVRKR